jgi:hypothetical protein
VSLPACCPSCGTKGPVDIFLAEPKYKAAFAEALKIPPALADLVLPYLGLFAPPSGRAIRADKLLRVSRELRELVTSGQVTRKGITQAAPLDAWRYGMEQTIAARDAGSLELPLDDHNYMASIVWRQANKAAGRQESGASKVSHPSHKVYEDEGRSQDRQDLQAELAHFKRLQAMAPNEQTAKQIAALEAKLNDPAG